jgi:hypothetical protein
MSEPHNQAKGKSALQQRSSLLQSSEYAGIFPEESRKMQWSLRMPVRKELASAAILLVCLGGAVAFHTPYKPEKSRHFDVTKSETFVPVTDKVTDTLTSWMRKQAQFVLP